MINRHSDYLAKGDIQRHTISQHFFEKVDLFYLLNDYERHSIISKATKKLWNVHQGWNNFHNEPPFAERLLELSKQGSLPLDVQKEFVETVVGCYIGNGHGFSWKADPIYEQMISEFSPKEIQHMIEIPLQQSSLVARRIKSNSTCRKKFQKALKLIDVSSVPSAVRVNYARFVGQ